MRRVGWLLAGLTGVGLASMLAAQAAPNPYGQATSTMQIEITADGGYSVVHTMTQELVLEASVQFEMVLPDAVRLPDDPAHPLPGLLSATVVEITGEQDGQAVEVTNASVGRRLDYELPGRDDLPAGDYTGVLRYSRTGATLPDDAGNQTYLQLPRASQVSVSAPGEISQARCGTRPGVFVPCGSASAAGWTIAVDEFGGEDAPRPWYPQVVVVTWAPTGAVLAPTDIRYG